MELKRLEHIYDVTEHLRAYQRPLSGANEKCFERQHDCWVEIGPE